VSTVRDKPAEASFIAQTHLDLARRRERLILTSTLVCASLSHVLCDADVDACTWCRSNEYNRHDKREQKSSDEYLSTRAIRAERKTR